MGISKTDATRRKLTRGEILYLLYISQNAPMQVKTIELALLPENPNIGAELVPQINFLNDRGYIEIVNPEECNATNPARGMLVRITDRGQDVVEYTTEDASVLFGNADR